MDMDQYLGAFLDEAADQLQSLNDLLLNLENEPGSKDIIQEIFRVAHTLKGMSATMGFERMSSLTHAMEDMLDRVRNDELALGEDDISLLFQCLDLLTEMVEGIRGGGSDADYDSAPLKETIKKRLSQEDEEEESGGGADSEAVHEELTPQEREWLAEAHEQGMNVFRVTVTLEEECMLKAARAYMVVSKAGDFGVLIKTAPPVEELEQESFGRSFVLYIGTHEQEERVRRSIGKISEIAEVAVEEPEELASREAGGESAEPEAPGEPAGSEKQSEEASSSREAPQDAEAPTPANAKAQAKEKVKRTGQTVRVDIGRLDKLMNLVGELVIGRARIERLAIEAEYKAFEEPLSQLGRISSEIQELVTKLRMVPVSFVFDKFPRLVRDLSKNMGKKVSLTVEGKETELDRTVIDEIGDPLVHLIRNSVDHGIEMPEKRKEAGKPQEGSLYIAAYQEGNGVIIEVEDDGKGIDPEKVKQKAVEKNLVTSEEAQNMTDDEAIRMVFLPGFSTASEVTDLSGRGVGMDAVQSKVQSLGGQFQIESEVGKGSRVVIRLPLTLAIVLALLVEVGGETYAISLENVEETLLVETREVRHAHGTPVTNVRGEILPLRDLSTILNAESMRKEEDIFPVVVVRAGRGRVGLIVDDLIGQQEIVIKPLGKLLSKVRGVSGATILGDGNVALILDATSLYTRKAG
ncbi:MAG: chemotaxis protein CheA [Synergistales bacterium]|nr:chemotaxis protein CheA [Synergistales bacterium]